MQHGKIAMAMLSRNYFSGTHIASVTVRNRAILWSRQQKLSQFVALANQLGAHVLNKDLLLQ